MFVICGLGNPGKRYIDTRHNIGFLFIDRIIQKYKFEFFKKDKFKETYLGLINRKKIFLIKPLTYVNLSGVAIKNFLNYYKIPNEKLIVVHDDLDIALGKIKIKLGGGNGGHKGLVNIDSLIGNLYYRVRIGIGRPKNNELINKFVLEKFNSKEKKLVDNLVNLSVNNLNLLISNKELFLSKIISFP